MPGISPTPSRMESTGVSRVDDEPLLLRGRPHSDMKTRDSFADPLASESRDGARATQTQREAHLASTGTVHAHRRHERQVPLTGSAASVIDRGRFIPGPPTRRPELPFSGRGRRYQAGAPPHLNREGKTTATAVPMWRSQEGTYDDQLGATWSRLGRTVSPDGSPANAFVRSKRHYSHSMDLSNRKTRVAGISEAMQASTVPVNPSATAVYDALGRWIDYSSRAYGGPHGERPPREYDTGLGTASGTEQSLLTQRSVLKGSGTASFMLQSPTRPRTSSLLPSSLPSTAQYLLVPRGTGDSGEAEGKLEVGTAGMDNAATGMRSVFVGSPLPALRPATSPMKSSRSGGGGEGSSTGGLHSQHSRGNLEASSLVVTQASAPQLNPAEHHPSGLSRVAAASRGGAPGTGRLDARFDSGLHRSSMTALGVGEASRDGAPLPTEAQHQTSVAASESVTGLYGTLGTVSATLADGAASYPTPAVVPHPDAYLARKGKLVTAASSPGARMQTYFPAADGTAVRPTAGSFRVPLDVGVSTRDPRARAGLALGPGAVPRPMTVAELRTAAMPLVGGGRSVRDLVGSPYGLIDESVYVRADAETLAPRAVLRRQAGGPGEAWQALSDTQAAFRAQGTSGVGGTVHYLEPHEVLSPGGQVVSPGRPASMHRAMRRHAGLREGGDPGAVPKPGTAAPQDVVGAAPSPTPGFDAQRTLMGSPGQPVGGVPHYPGQRGGALAPTPTTLPRMSPMDTRTRTAASGTQDFPAAGVPTELSMRAKSPASFVQHTDVRLPSQLVGSALARAQAREDSTAQEALASTQAAEERYRAVSAGTLSPEQLHRVPARPLGLLMTDLHAGREGGAGSARYAKSTLGKAAAREAQLGAQEAYKEDGHSRGMALYESTVPSYLGLPSYVAEWQGREARGRPGSQPTPQAPGMHVAVPRVTEGQVGTLQGGATMHGYFQPSRAPGGPSRASSPLRPDTAGTLAAGLPSVLPLMAEGPAVGNGERARSASPSSRSPSRGRRSVPGGARPAFDSSAVAERLDLTSAGRGSLLLSGTGDEPRADSGSSATPPKSPSPPTLPSSSPMGGGGGSEATGGASAVVATAPASIARPMPTHSLGPLPSILSVDAPVSLSSLFQHPEGGGRPSSRGRATVVGLPGGESRATAASRFGRQGSGMTVQTADQYIEVLRTELRSRG